MKLLKFYKENCAPCKSVDSYLKTLNADYQEVHAFNEPDMSAKYRLNSVPTLILIDDEGNEVSRSIGFKPEEIKELVAQL
ncbi:thioredoxin family protein [Paenibacillus sp. JSM ZJ436]|uniref:thioredoxin family protein n=1 Tax=Paenibacillus sp. JSM ZJ436 TaxID=3376190 RepID=UPI00378F0CF6